MCRHLFLSILAILAGCVSSGIVPTGEEVANIKRVHIVAMEAPPLGVPPYFQQISGFGGSITAARGIGIFNTIAILVQMPEESRRGGEVSQSLTAAMNSRDAWIPTVFLAKEVRAQLEAIGIAGTVDPEINVLPNVQDRSYTVFMENWLAPIRAWYGDPGLVSDYSRVPFEQKTTVIEVGILNYEITSERLLLQVLIKMIDPYSGRVIGRVRADNSFSQPDLAPLEDVFANDADRFKKTFSTTGRELVKKCLVELGLMH